MNKYFFLFFCLISSKPQKLTNQKQSTNSTALSTTQSETETWDDIRTLIICLKDKSQILLINILVLLEYFFSFRWKDLKEITGQIAIDFHHLIDCF